MHYLSAEDILGIHSAMINETGGSHGVRDTATLALLEDLPRQAVFGQELYPTVFLKAAVYVHSLIFSHPFIDGNKRTAMATADVFLQLNGCHITTPQGGVEKFALAVIEKRMTLEEIATWLKQSTKERRI